MPLVPSALRVLPRLAAALALVARAAAAPACHGVLGNIAAENIGGPVPSQTLADCCAACAAAQPACASWTFTAPGAQACYLHSDTTQGVDPSSPYASGTCGDDDAWLDPLGNGGVADGPVHSGVPVGGVGVGWFDIAMDGGISRVAINNWHQDGVIWDTNASFLAIFRASSGASLLQRRPSVARRSALAYHKRDANDLGRPLWQRAARAARLVRARAARCS